MLAGAGLGNRMRGPVNFLAIHEQAAGPGLDLNFHSVDIGAAEAVLRVWNGCYARREGQDRRGLNLDRAIHIGWCHVAAIHRYARPVVSLTCRGQNGHMGAKLSRDFPYDRRTSREFSSPGRGARNKQKESYGKGSWHLPILPEEAEKAFKERTIPKFSRLEINCGKFILFILKVTLNFVILAETCVTDPNLPL